MTDAPELTAVLDELKLFADTLDTAIHAHRCDGAKLLEAQRKKEARFCFEAALRFDPQDAMSYNNLANLLQDSNHAKAAGRAYVAAIQLQPDFATAYMNLASLLRQKPGWRPHAVRAARVVLRLMPSSRQAVLDLGDVLTLHGQPRAANLTFALGVERGMWQHAQQRPAHFVASLVARPWWTPTDLPVVRKLLSPSAVAVLRTEGLALLRKHERSRRAMKAPNPRTAYASTDSLPSTAFKPYHSAALSQGSWSDVTLAVHGARQPGAREAPRAYALYRTLGEDICPRRLTFTPTLTPHPLHLHPHPHPHLHPHPGEDALSMVSGSAYFSLLSPRARLLPHCGPTNVRLRVHLGLRVPSSTASEERGGGAHRAGVWAGGGRVADESRRRSHGDRTEIAGTQRGERSEIDVGMRVANESRPWREGEALVFDDSFEHEAWNDSDEPRLIFVMDVWHPELVTDAQRLAALDEAAQQRYRAVVRSLRKRASHEQSDLPEARVDALAAKRGPPRKHKANKRNRRGGFNDLRT